MKLKRILSKQTIQRRDNSKEVKIPKSENLLYRQSGGLCFDVCPYDSTMYVKSAIYMCLSSFICRYLCGTEEGLIHRCSLTNNEQYLDTYAGHSVSFVEVLGLCLIFLCA